MTFLRARLAVTDRNAVFRARHEMLQTAIAHLHAQAGLSVGQSLISRLDANR
jgi:hypothetical protein